MATSASRVAAAGRPLRLGGLAAGGGGLTARARATTTPGRLRAARALLVFLILATGALGAFGGGVRSDAARGIATRGGPVTSDVLEAYGKLADADVMAAAGFLPGSSSAERERFERDIEGAAASLSRAAGRSGGEPLTLDRISDISAALSVYTGLVAGARVENRVGAEGGTEFEGASDLMQSTLLRRAQALQRDEAGRLSRQYERAGSVPVLALGCGLMTLALLLLVQVRLFRRTRRILNVGLAGATALMVGLALWWGLAFSVSQDHLDSSRRHSRAVTEGWGQAQIAARQARASEILALVSDPQTAASYGEQLAARMQRLSRDDGAGGALGAARQLGSTSDGPALVDAAVTETRAWVATHARLRELSNRGRRDEAVAVAVGPAAATFDRLDVTLGRAAAVEQDAFRKEIDASRRALRGLVAGTVVLALAAAGCVTRGIAKRLEDYR